MSDEELVKPTGKTLMDALIGYSRAADGDHIAWKRWDEAWEQSSDTDRRDALLMMGGWCRAKEDLAADAEQRRWTEIERRIAAEIKVDALGVEVAFLRERLAEG